MRIGIDIDDTIADTHGKLIEEALKYDKLRVNGKGFKNLNGNKFVELFYWTRTDVEGFLRYIASSNYYSTLDSIKDASKYINKLYNEGNEIIFITRRKNVTKVKTLTKKWLNDNGFKYNKVIFGSEDKGIIGNNLGIDLLIDNDIKNIIDALDYGIKGILITDSYNKDEYELTRFNNWKEIYDCVRGMTDGKNC